MQDNRRSPNRIEPHTMPRPGISLADTPLVRCLPCTSSRCRVPTSYICRQTFLLAPNLDMKAGIVQAEETQA